MTDWRKCPACGAECIVRFVSLSTSEPDVIAVLTQCSKDSSHVYAFYFKYQKYTDKHEEAIKFAL